MPRKGHVNNMRTLMIALLARRGPHFERPRRRRLPRRRQHPPAQLHRLLLLPWQGHGREAPRTPRVIHHIKMVVACAFLAGCLQGSAGTPIDPLILSPSDFPPGWKTSSRADQGWDILSAWGLEANPGTIEISRFYSSGAIPVGGWATALTNGTATLIQTVLRFDDSASVGAFMAQADRCRDGTVLAGQTTFVRLAVIAESDAEAQQVQRIGVDLLLHRSDFRNPCP
jgi:hypothetical protein